ncbi:hypothetical protein PT286_00110 [Neisseriaceae bacterium ESL0693]|nr:hypothetical protein [Neisseriaceae bacterium ESL0693]
MKWLFAILVVLNIVVFGSMVASKLVRDNARATPTEASMPMTAPMVTTPPASPNISIQSDTAITPAENDKPATDSKHTKPTKTEQSSQPAENDKEKNNRKDNNRQAAGAGDTCTATVSLPEDDFHRIKGLFSQWPFTTSRFVEKLDKPKPRPARQTPTRYAVTLPASNDNDLRTHLQSQGFDYGIVQGQISLGVFNRRNDAESLLARAKMHGFSEASVMVMNNERDQPDDGVTSVAKIRVVFSGVNKAAIQDINNVVSHYGQLQHSGVCQ